MKIVVIGSGLIGITTAYFLRRRRHEVTVIDQGESPGQETSFAYGALLTPSMAEPWNAPRSWHVLLASLGRSDAAMQPQRPARDPDPRGSRVYPMGESRSMLDGPSS